MNHWYVTLRKVKDTKRKFALSWKIWKLLEVTTGNDFSSSFKEFKENSEVDGSVEDYGKELKGALLQVFRKYFGGIYEINKVELSNESLTADFFQFSSAITRCWFLERRLEDRRLADMPLFRNSVVDVLIMFFIENWSNFFLFLE